MEKNLARTFDFEKELFLSEPHINKQQEKNAGIRIKMSMISIYLQNSRI